MKKIMQTFYECRQSQKDYFANPSQYRLKIAKQKEAAADAIIDDAMQNNYIIPVQKVNVDQSKLFS
ncbi:hypothetical protein [Limnovirga soli]|uniref:Uncharacterized protein n=1 Tax=Limnovirga soli TaxID=2656915 RepID=A0A8J8FAM3_9BACT|nr:hypothetical protein [Limnovirga soli]NNV54555.1 hypothetical protein [Limnovirga soli]